MRLLPLVCVAFVSLVGCGSESGGNPPTPDATPDAVGDPPTPDATHDAVGDPPTPDAMPDAGMDGDGNSCDGGGRTLEGCPCATEGLYQCFGGSGIECLNGVWKQFVDGPCWLLDGANNCTDEAVGCICPIFSQRICVSGHGLECVPGLGRWGNNPAACGDAGRVDADSDSPPAPDAGSAPDVGMDGDGNSCDGGGRSLEGCPCATEGLYECFSGSGIECLNGTWRRFLDGACWLPDGSNTCTDRAVGCICPIFRERICVSGQGLECVPGLGRWGNNPAACGDAGRSD
jgi:hypothetical protein